ncbi:MAG: threonine-phosphate decarboxylase [Verrucomicrobiaceae bacterium]|nr:threonine-phosphate decarboxylase [Verrucomicrobiaceae bacterium]
MITPNELLPIPPAHGADLAAASQRYGIALSDWLDVSTGINPRAYPVGAIDPALFQHLPFGDDELRSAAKNYCVAPALPIAAAGSQTLIQWLPLVKAQLTKRQCRVAVPSIGYSEHEFRWRWAGHEIIYYDPRDSRSIDKLLDERSIDVLVVINAHNPLGSLISAEQLLTWQQQLEKNDGWLIIDEAFIDATPEYSVAAHTQRAGLIVLRSLGKFFGLAGVRCGFAFACDEILAPLQIAIGPWNVAGPTIAIATQALRDNSWQQTMRIDLKTISAENVALLQQKNWAANNPFLRNALFNSIELPVVQAAQIENKLAQRGIRVRRIEINAGFNLLRFGLVDPSQSDTWRRYKQALNNL